MKKTAGLRPIREFLLYLRKPRTERYVMSWERVEQERWDKDIDRLLLFVQPIAIAALLGIAWLEAHHGLLWGFLNTSVMVGALTWLWLRIARRRLA